MDRVVRIDNWIDSDASPPNSGEYYTKVSPATGEPISEVARSGAADVNSAVQAATLAAPGWSATPGVVRGEKLLAIVLEMRRRRAELARVVADETGKSLKDAFGETDGAAALGLFYASEGQRLYGRTTTSAVANRQAFIVREPVGIAGLIIAANTPIANVAWKVFPALICGNTAVLKAAEDTPHTAFLFAQMARDAGLPAGVLNVVFGFGNEAGAPLVDHPDVGVISFTGSTAVGREIAIKAARRLAKVSLELGGKNPLVVCDDCNLEQAVRWTVLSSFSNAGQRCAAGSRVIVFDSIYDRFRDALISATKALKVGPSDDDDVGPVISQRQLDRMTSSVKLAANDGARILVGGGRLDRPGFYMAPTVLDGVDPADDLSRCELFGPIASLYRAENFEHAVALANDADYGLTAAIHTNDYNRALEFARRVQSGLVSINAGTYGSEPHMPFGGLKQSGNGTREPGTEALEIYSNYKNILVNTDPGAV